MRTEDKVPSCLFSRQTSYSRVVLNRLFEGSYEDVGTLWCGLREYRGAPHQLPHPPSALDRLFVVVGFEALWVGLEPDP